MTRLILVYPSCRPSHILPCISRTSASTSVPLHFSVGYNGPPLPLPHPPNALLHHYGETLFDPPFTAATNQSFRRAVTHFNVQDHELIGFWADDFHPVRDWGAELVAMHKHSKKPFLCPQDGIMRFSVATIPFATLAWWKAHMGGIMWPPMYRYMVDVEPTRKAKLLGDFQEVPRARIVHRHHFLGTRERDEVDAHNAIVDNQDSETLAIREVAGFPVTWNEEGTWERIT